MARKATRPVDVARHQVDQWFESLLETDQVFTAGSIYQAEMGEAFDIVQEAVKRADYAERPNAKPSVEDELAEVEAFARTAGYLIGVQVGLRLRAAGGAR